MRIPGKNLSLWVPLVAGLLVRPAHAEDWTSFAPRTGGRLAVEPSGPKFEADWQHEMPAERQPVYRALLASPTVADGMVVLGNYGDRLRALDETSGKPRWDATVPGPHHASMAAWRGWLFVPSVDMTLTAVRLADGVQVWKRPLPGMGFSSPQVIDDQLFLATAEPQGRLLCLDAETGETLWQNGAEQLQKGAYPALVAAQDRLLVAESRGRLHSFARADGQWQWSADAAGMINVSAPVVVGQRVFLLSGGDEARLHAFALDTGVPVPGFPLTLPRPADTTGAGTFLGREHVLSSLAGTTGLLVFGWRVDERFDNNADAAPDRFVARESLLALDPQTGATLWTAPAGQLDVTDGNRIPLHATTTTPVLYPGAAGVVMVAATSSLEARLRVLAGATGTESFTAPLGGPTRSSPVFANGRLVVATDAGTVHAFLSTTNQPPVAPLLGFSPSGGREVDATAVTIRWGTAVDPEMAAVAYEVRVDADDEILHSWQVGKQTSATELALGPLASGRYTFAVRARDPAGALSAWSAPAVFQAFAPPEVVVDGTPAASLDEALGRAGPGAVIKLGAGTFVLSKTVEVPAGVTLTGAGPHLTVLSGRGLEVAVNPAAGARLSQLTVAWAEVGVTVAGADVHLTNVILRDNARAGIEVAVAGSALLVNGTVTRNGTGVRALGSTSVRNTLCVGNDVGLFTNAPTTLLSRYNDVVGNRTADYQGRAADATDLAAPVSFTGEPDHLRLAPAQPSTDRGDPSDAFANEPAPNGARINIGAFGNTVFAELSALGPDLPDAGVEDGGTADGSAGSGGRGGAADGGAGTEPPGGGCGCDVGGRGPGAGAGLLLALGLGVSRLRRRRRR